MRKNRLPGLKDSRVRLRPPARWFDEAGNELEPADHEWGVGQASQDGLVLINRRGPLKVVGLKPDAIHHFQEAVGDRRGTLLLNVQVFIQGNDFFVESLMGPKREPAHMPIRLPRRTTRNLTFGQVLLIGVVGLILVGTMKA